MVRATLPFPERFHFDTSFSGHWIERNHMDWDQGCWEVKEHDGSDSLETIFQSWRSMRCGMVKMHSRPWRICRSHRGARSEQVAPMHVETAVKDPPSRLRDSETFCPDGCHIPHSFRTGSINKSDLPLVVCWQDFFDWIRRFMRMNSDDAGPSSFRAKDERKRSHWLRYQNTNLRSDIRTSIERSERAHVSVCYHARWRLWDNIVQ
jgi:hypothetical protein